MSDQNKSENAAEVRESIRKGLQPTRYAKEEASMPGARRFVGRKWECQSVRFLFDCTVEIFGSLRVPLKD